MRYLPFDVANVELGHNGLECTLDAIIKKSTTERSLALRRLAYSIPWIGTSANLKSNANMLSDCLSLPATLLVPWVVNVALNDQQSE